MGNLEDVQYTIIHDQTVLHRNQICHNFGTALQVESTMTHSGP